MFVQLSCSVNQNEAGPIFAVIAWWKTLPVDGCNLVRRPVGLVVENLVDSRLLADFAGPKIVALVRSH